MVEKCMATEQDSALFGWDLKEWNIEHDHQDYEATNQVGRSQEFPGSEEAPPPSEENSKKCPNYEVGKKCLRRHKITDPRQNQKSQSKGKSQSEARHRES